MKPQRFFSLLFLWLVALVAYPADSGNFKATDIRVLKVEEGGKDFLAVYFNPIVVNNNGKKVGYGAYLYTTNPSNSIKVSKFESFEVKQNMLTGTDYCLMIPFESVPQSYWSDKLRVLIAAYESLEGGSNPWRQDGSWWGPEFVMSQMPTTSNPPKKSSFQDFTILFLEQDYVPANGTAPNSLVVKAKVTARNQNGNRCSLLATLYTSPNSQVVKDGDGNVSAYIPYNVTSNFDERIITLSIPWTKIPASLSDQQVHLSLTCFVMENGKWVSQPGGVWAPEFVPSKLGAGKNNPPRPVVGSTPVLEWLNLPASTQTKQLKIKVGVKSASTITATSVSVNGTSVRGVKSVTNDGYDLMINESATLKEGDNVIVVKVTNANGTTTEERHVTYAPKGSVPASAKPKLTWIQCPETSTTSQLLVKVGINSTSTITSANLYVNGQSVRGVTPVKNDGYDMMLIEQVPLIQGVNIVKAVVTNSAGTTTEERQVTYGSQPIVNPIRPDNNVDNLKRIALVVGNAKYPGMELANTVNDASAMSSKLRNLGFDVIYVTDATRRTMDTKINEFGQKARDYDVAMFYYAGHGIQYRGFNYLIPIDANLASESDIEYECVNVNKILSKLEDSGCRVNIIALDACRNNPFERSWHRGVGGGRGLSAINVPIGTIISYATSPGTTASDGTTDHSPYTAAFLDALDEPNLPIEAVFKYIGSEVFKHTNQTQRPWYSSSLFDGDFIFNQTKK